MEKVHNKSMKSTNIKTKLLVSAAMFVACLHPGSLLAQDAQQDQGAQTEEDVVVVVGSQIKGASVTEALPVSVLGATEIDAIGAASLDEVFRTLPGMGAQPSVQRGQILWALVLTVRAVMSPVST